MNDKNFFKMLKQSVMEVTTPILENDISEKEILLDILLEEYKNKIDNRRKQIKCDHSWETVPCKFIEDTMTICKKCGLGK